VFEAFKVGDNVVVQPGIFDKDCSKVKEGKENLSPSYGIIGETHDGIQSEYVSLDPINLHRMPDRLSFCEASSMALVFMTSYQMLVKRAKISKSDRVLVYGATSGVGGAAIQIAKDLGCNVLTTVGEKSKIEYAESLGADAVFLHNSALYGNIIKHIGNNRIDVVFEHIGEKTWETSTRLLSKGGRLVTCGATTGANVSINLVHIFFKQLSILGSTMSTLESFREVFDKIDNGRYTAMIDRVFPFSDIAQAHKRIECRENLGKVIVEFD
jgi:NADPH:quinone reductase-like Zn-dependent oxidoreductase